VSEVQGVFLYLLIGVGAMAIDLGDEARVQRIAEWRREFPFLGDGMAAAIVIGVCALLWPLFVAIKLFKRIWS
jgi:hypothetical protein